MKSEYVAIMCNSAGRCISVAKVKTLSKQEVAELINQANIYETEKEEEHKREVDEFERKIGSLENEIKELKHSISIILGEEEEEEQHEEE